MIDSNAYPLASDYRHIFLADNNTCREIIWPLAQDGLRAQSSAGTNFYVKAFVNGPMNELYQTGVGSKGWGNVRAKMTLVDAFDPADVAFRTDDTWGNTKNDKRAQFMTALDNQKKETWDNNQAMTSTFTCGYGYIKWRNVTKDDKECASGITYTSIDFPLFRTGDAYLMAAEAILRSGGNRADALKYVNEIRERAYMSGKYAKAGVLISHRFFDIVASPLHNNGGALKEAPPNPTFVFYAFSEIFSPQAGQTKSLASISASKQTFSPQEGHSISKVSVSSSQHSSAQSQHSQSPSQSPSPSASSSSSNNNSSTSPRSSSSSSQ